VGARRPIRGRFPGSRCSLPASAIRQTRSWSVYPTWPPRRSAVGHAGASFEAVTSSRGLDPPRSIGLRRRSPHHLPIVSMVVDGEEIAALLKRLTGRERTSDARRGETTSNVDGPTKCCTPAARVEGRFSAPAFYPRA